MKASSFEAGSSINLVDVSSLLIAGLVGLLIYTSLRRFGIGISTDAVNYLFTAFNLTSGHGWISYDTTPYTWWPPLYPALLAGLHLLTGADLVAIALWVNIATFIGMVIATWQLARQLFAGRPALVFWSVLLAAGAQMMVASAQNAGSDYLAALLAVVGLLAAGSYIRKPGWAAWAWLFLTGMLSALQRYIGVTVIAVAGLVVLVYYRGTLQRRLAAAAAQGLALVPLAFWAWHNLLAGTGPFGPRIPATNSLGTNFDLTFKVMMGWIIPPGILARHILRSELLFGAGIAVVAGILIAGLTITLVRKVQVLPFLGWLVVFYAVLFPLALVANASLAWFKDITDRFLVPAYIPILLTVFLALDLFLRWLAGKISGRLSSLVCTALAILVPLLVLWTAFAGSVSLVQASRSVGVLPDNLYHNPDWNSNPTVEAVRQQLADHPDAVLYSNQPPGFALFTWHTTYWSPLKHDAIFKDHRYPLGDFATAFTHCSAHCYLVWKLPHPYDHLYLPDELSRIARMDVIFQSTGGIIYQISRR